MSGSGNRRRRAAPSGNGSADRAVAEWLDHLFSTVRPPDGTGEFSYQAVADAMARSGGPTVSARTIRRLRRGERPNPTRAEIQALARFFRVSPIGCFGPAARRRLEADLLALEALRDPAVRQLSLGLADLSAWRVADVSAEVEARLGDVALRSGCRHSGTDHLRGQRGSRASKRSRGDVGS
jgi:hypothetical protein